MKKIFKRIAAITTGAAMLGATLTSALAQDLSGYPSPFSVNGKHDTSTRIVVGDQAKAIDTVGAADIHGQLQRDSYTTSAGGGGSAVVVTGGVSDQVPISRSTNCGIQSCNSVTYFDAELEDDDIEILQDTKITFQSKDYDIHDALVIGSGSPSIETSLTLPDDDLGTHVAMKVDRDTIKYYYLFDKAINVSQATSSDALEIKFLGQRLKITGATHNSITAQVGQEFFMDVFDTITSEGRTVRLVNVGTTAVVVEVDGAKETITNGATKTVQGIEIHVDEIFYEDSREQRSAVLIVGKDATDTYTDGEEWRTGNDDWDWDIGNLTSSTTSTLTTGATPSVTAGPYIGIENDFVVNSDDDKGFVSTNPAHEKCYSLPNDYLQICLDSLNVDDSDYVRVKVELETSLDETKAWSDGSTSAKAILITTPGETQGLEIESDISAAGFTDNLTSDFKTSKIWITDRNASALDVYYHDDSDTSNSPKWAGVVNSLNGTFTTIGRVNFKDTKGSNVEIDVDGFAPAADSWNLTFDILGDETSSPVNGDDDITIQLSHAAGGAFDGLGDTPDSEEAAELKWNSTTIGTKDENHRTIYGIIIRDPKSNGANDEVVLDIPGDQVLANVVIRGTDSSTSGGSGGNKISVQLPSKLTILSSEVGSAANHNLILVGGPCVNPTISQVSALSAYNSCEGWSLRPGEAVIKLVNNGNKVAMLVAGTLGEDTRRATTVVANYGDYTLSGTEKIVKGTTQNDITVA